ncbi:28689_t:CDS:2, partial [Racocetra persica]
EITINRIQVYVKFGVPITQRDSGEIKRKSIAMTRSKVVKCAETERCEKYFREAGDKWQMDSQHKDEALNLIKLKYRY